MRTTSIVFLLACMTFGCNQPTELSILDSVKPADEFSRKFINKVITGKLESAYKDIDIESQDTLFFDYIRNANRNINNQKIIKYKVIEQRVNTTYVLNEDKLTLYTLGYEYEFNNRHIIFLVIVKEKDNKFSIANFEGKFLENSLEHQNQFTLINKSSTQYFYLIFSISIIIFILISWGFLLNSDLPLKKKLIWSLIILLVAFPQFTIDWNSGQVEFHLLNFNLFSTSFYKPNLYSPWFLSFNLPIGAIIYWFKRRSLNNQDE